MFKKSVVRFYAGRPVYLLYARGFRISTNTQERWSWRAKSKSSDLPRTQLFPYNFLSIIFQIQCCSKTITIANDTKSHERNTFDTQ